MTISIRTENLGLVYRLRQGLTLAPGGQDWAVGGRISGDGRTRFVTALDDVSFELRSGDRLGLVGPNGAGKTTLLKVLYGIYAPTSGSVQVEGRIDALFNISLGFRREVTGRRNVVLRGLINGQTREQIEARMDEIIAFSELGEFIDMPLKAYSTGMSARLAFSIATAMDPEILLMDEWISAGDRSFREKARARMDELAQRAGIIILASHDQSLIERTCNKVLVLEEGKVKSFGGTELLPDLPEEMQRPRARGRANLVGGRPTLAKGSRS